MSKALSNEMNEIKPTEFISQFNANDIAWHPDIQLKGRIREAIQIATVSPDFTIDDAYTVLKEEVAWLDRIIKNAKL